jgi:crotonobetainyl-CoA:carnitine CoA-transferase CaiB-like acyl-CoA transferase
MLEGHHQRIADQLGVDMAGESPVFDEHCGPARLRRSPSRRRFCFTGQHAGAILTELGYSAERIAGLRERKVVG